MQFDHPKRNVVKVEIEKERGLKLYVDPPQETVTLEEFEELAIDRLTMLRIFEAVNVKSKNVKDRQNIKSELMNKLRSENLNGLFKLQDETEARRDYLSHFILRLAFCKTEALRSWFLDQEIDLFRQRFVNLTSPEQLQFIKANELPYDVISDREKEKWMSELNKQYDYLGDSFLRQVHVFKVCFTQIDNLLRRRKVFLHNGFAYLPLQEMESLVTSFYRAHLAKALAKTRKSLPNLEEDDRCLRILEGLPLCYTGKDYGSLRNIGADEITADMIEPLSKQSFPPCMKSLCDNFHSNHHLRHFGRMQLGLFLKGIGVRVDESIRFWKEKFCKKVTEDEFTKKYLYNIRHNYGQEGNRRNYTPYSCMKIITGTNITGSDHGCPFRHWDRPELKKFLNQNQIGIAESQKICNLVDSQHYNIACTCYFEATQGAEPEQAISHPNQYFEESRRIIKNKT